MKKILFTLALLTSLACNTQKQEIVYYESGEVKSKANYVDGIQQGEETGYYKSGAVWYKSNIVDGKGQGEFILYYESGAVKFIQNYVDGVLIED